MAVYHESNPIKEENETYPTSLSDLFRTEYPALGTIY